MKYILMCIAIVCSVVSSCFLKDYGRKVKTQGAGDVFLFNAFISLIWAILLGGVFIISGNTTVSQGTYFYGAIYGVILCAFLLTKTFSLKSGPVSLTTLIGSCAFIIVVWYGMLCFDEKLNIFQIVGMIAVVISLTLCIKPKNSGEKLSLKWFILTMLFLIAGGFVGIIYKLFGASESAGEVDAMMLTAALVSAVLFAVLAVIINLSQKSGMPRLSKESWKFVLICGVLSLVYQRLNISLSAVIPSAVFFPVSNGSVVILSAVFGKLFFKEKLTPIQLLGIFMGLISIMVIGLSDVLMSLVA